jgi:hypothetical protein
MYLPRIQQAAIRLPIACLIATCCVCVMAPATAAPGQTASWTNVFPDPDPGRRSNHSMTYDSRRGVVVLHGGDIDRPDRVLRDTWEWDGAAWTLRAVDGPTAHSGNAMCFDCTRVTVLFGGAPGVPQTFGVYRSDTGSDGTSWMLRSQSGPSGRRWRWRTTAIATYASFSAGTTVARF